MTTTQLSERALDSSARRMARAAGYIARKSRRRRDSCDNAGEYMLIDANSNFCVCGHRYDMTAAEVIAWCKGD